jgi:hypothetical protein
VISSKAWCDETERHLTDNEYVRDDLEAWLSENVSQLTELTKIVSRSETEPNKRRTVVSLIT